MIKKDCFQAEVHAFKKLDRRFLPPLLLFPFRVYGPSAPPPEPRWPSVAATILPGADGRLLRPFLPSESLTGDLKNRKTSEMRIGFIVRDVSTVKLNM